MRFSRFLVLLLLAGLVFASCNRSTCPTYDKKSGEMKMKKKGKTRSGVLPP